MNALREAGHQVVAVAPEDTYSRKLWKEGYFHRPFPLDAASTNPMLELRSILSLRGVLDAERADAVLSFTPKGNIYSGLALAGRSTTFIANLSGLGRAFAGESRLRWLVKPLYKRALARASAVLFQNGEDLRYMVGSGLVDATKAQRVPGSGVDLRKFAPQNDSLADGYKRIVFLFVARLLWAKGIDEYVEAARIIKMRHGDICFRVLGPLEQSKAGVPKKNLDAWVRDGTIEYLGIADDVREYLKAADCIVLPTYYREGVPRSLLEAAAMAKPVIATDIAGCRDAVTDVDTGFLCRPQDVSDLVAAFEKFIALSTAERRQMGARGRTKMEAEFDETVVIDRYLNLVCASACCTARSASAGAAAITPNSSPVKTAAGKTRIGLGLVG